MVFIMITHIRNISAAAALVAATTASSAYWRGNVFGSTPGFVTALVERGAVAAAVTATGTLNPVASVEVGSYVSGPIQAIDVDFNSKVKKGQRLAKIDPAPLLASHGVGPGTGGLRAVGGGYSWNSRRAVH